MTNTKKAELIVEDIARKNFLLGVGIDKDEIFESSQLLYARMEVIRYALRCDDIADLVKAKDVLYWGEPRDSYEEYSGGAYMTRDSNIIPTLDEIVEQFAKVGALDYTEKDLITEEGLRKPGVIMKMVKELEKIGGYADIGK